MPLETFIPRAQQLGGIAADLNDGNGFDFDTEGLWSMVAQRPWAYSATDEQAIGDMTQVAAYAIVTVEGPIELFVKADPQCTVNVSYSTVAGDTASATASAAAAAVSAGEASDSADAADASATAADASADAAAASAALFPALPGTGTFTLKSIDDTLTWVED